MTGISTIILTVVFGLFIAGCIIYAAIDMVNWGKKEVKNLK